jgi:hypothetical protein
MTEREQQRLVNHRLAVTAMLRCRILWHVGGPSEDRILLTASVRDPRNRPDQGV